MKGNWFRNLFKSSKNDIEDFEFNEPSLEEKVDLAIRKCQDDKREAENTIDKLRKWANDAIREVFYVPHKYWYCEIEEYGLIKQSPQNNKISASLISQSDKIIEGYKQQIELNRSKIVLCNNLTEKYLQAKKELELLQEKIEREEKSQQKLNQLKQHSQRLQELDDETTTLENSYYNAEKLALMQEELHNIENEFKENSELQEQLDILHKVYDEDLDINTSIAFKKEVDKLITDL